MIFYGLEDKLIQKAKQIKLLILDVDGILTDGQIILSDSGDEIKHFNVRDGHGIKMIMRYGIEVAFLTGRASRVVNHRAKELGVLEVYQGIFDKVKVCAEIIKKKSLQFNEIAYMGDDVVDVPLLRRAGFSATVHGASEYVKNFVDYITTKGGGKGAVREVCEIILQVQGHWEELAKKYEMDDTPV
jgi:3-deoxy-D-manno-octulosonate 8-phosphate phosphatase (KDO 8-P phosphatase)